jgi:hypothetical protein
MEKSARLFAQAYEQSTKPTDCQSVYEPRRLSRAGSGMPQGDRSEPCFPVTFRLEFSSWRTFLPRREALGCDLFG